MIEFIPFAFLVFRIMTQPESWGPTIAQPPAADLESVLPIPNVQALLQAMLISVAYAEVHAGDIQAGCDNVRSAS